MKTKKIWTKVLVLALAVLMLATVLVSCGGGTKAKMDYSQGTSIDDDEPTKYFAGLLVQTLAADARQQFIAASRGYSKDDMGKLTVQEIQEGTHSKPENIVAYAKAALESIKPDENDANLTVFNAFLAQMDTPEEVQEVVDRVHKHEVSNIDLAAENGLWDTILVWVGQFLGLLTYITFGNYIGALFIFAIVVELIMLLIFGIKQQKNMQKQAALRPKEMAIRKKYAGRNDQPTMQKMQEEIQKLYQDAGVNPMSSCLPLLVQMPILIALYNIVVDPLRYVLGFSPALSQALGTFFNASPAAGGLGLGLTSSRGTIEMLSHLDAEKIALLRTSPLFSSASANACADALQNVGTFDFSFFGIPVNTGMVPSFEAPWLLLVPVLTFVCYFFSMKLTRKMNPQPMVQQAQDQQTGCSNKIMDYMMPIMSTAISLGVPAAVGIYWIFKSIITTLKQFLMNKIMPMPVCTEEMIKEAEREMKGKGNRPERAPGTRTTTDGRQVRSLHHIDDEDDDLLDDEN